ncbi:MAG: hypothetical protein FJ265_06645 [Planctomycetes bacterium]|nr:hypothetical protein [Planctomycetota bacterium]
MTAADPPPRSRNPHRRVFLPATLVLATALAVGFLAHRLGGLAERVAALADQLGQRDRQLEEIYGEIARLRIEQSTGQMGPAGLLAKLKTYAPLLVSSRTTQPDFEAAKKEMDAVLRAFATMGDRAWDPIVLRMQELDPGKNFDELKWLLEAMVRVDRQKGIDRTEQVLRGTLLPAPRLRWYAARMLIDLDKPRAQAALRHVLATESFRGLNPERAAAHGAPLPDPAATAQNGFANFVQYYVLSDDPELEETLLQVMGRAEHDPMTVQECVEVLGRRRCVAAVEPIRRVLKKPPGNVENPLFQNKCLDALAAIQGKQVVPFLEQALLEATTETVKNHITGLLAKLR